MDNLESSERQNPEHEENDMNRPATWKIVTFGAALTGLGATGIGVAAADDDRDRPLPAGVSVSTVDAPSDAPVDGPVDTSLERRLPNESATDSADDASPDTATPDDLTPDDATPDDRHPRRRPDHPVGRVRRLPRQLSPAAPPGPPLRRPRPEACGRRSASSGQSSTSR